QKPAAVVHLPPREVQEQHMREVAIAQERAAERIKDDEQHLAVAVESGNGEVASSPSSTVGPYSANTSRQEQHSPTTSPEEDLTRHHMRFGRAAATKEPTDEATTRSHRTEELARDSSPATPDAQLRLEEEQATRFARDTVRDIDASGKVGSDGPALRVSDLTKGASAVVDETRKADGSDRRASAPHETPAANVGVTGAIDGTNSVDSSKVSEPTPVGDGSANDAAAVESRDNVKSNQEPDADAEMRDVGTSPSGTGEGERPQLPQDNATRTSTENLGTLTRELSRPRIETANARPVESRDEERSKLSTVIFAKQDNPFVSKALQPMSNAYASLKGAAEDPDRDYLIGMFDFQAHPGPLSCRELLEKATKTFTTSNKYASIREVQDYKILKRVYTLQHANKWSLRQIEKSAEPPTKPMHHDHLLAEMKWMRTDFHEERKWKTAAAKNLAEWCAQWIRSSPEKRRSLQIRVRPNAKPQVEHSNEEEIESPPELIPSGAHETESESFPDDEENLLDFARSFPPAALFSLGFGDVVAKVENTPISEKVLDELPQYESRLRGSPGPASWGSSIKDSGVIPVSKFLTSKLVPKATEPPRKRSRYEYEEEEDSSSYSTRRPASERSNASTPSLRFSRVGLSPEQSNVALFLPENKHVRDRLHAGHSFRPPSEFPMPSTQFFESRLPSQWLWDEDQKLRQLVKEYSFNWSLVAASLESPSMFTSGAERRTPWECFERWVQLEGLPGEMAKTPYFRAYQQRLEAAQRTVSAQYQAAQQQAQQAAQTQGQMINTPRRRTAQPIRVERRRNNRYLALIDAMRKQARKRESTAHKQAENAKAAALRKAHEAAPVRQSVHTPMEFSRLKHEREQKMQEKMEMHRQLAASRRPGQMMAGQAIPGGMAPHQRNGTPNNVHGQANLGAGAAPQNGHLPAGINMQARSHPQNMPNGMNGLPMGVQGIPQAQMQMNMQGQRLQPHQDPNLRMALGQRNLSQQQQHFAMQQQQQQMSRAGSMSQMGQASGNIQSPAMLAASMGASKVNGAGMPPGSAASPRMNNHAAQPQALSSGHVPQITNIAHEIQLQNPQMSPQEVNRLAAERINEKMSVHTARQNAMNAAAGAAAAGAQAANSHMTPSPYQQNASLANGSASPSNQAQYQQQMRQHMMQQQRTQQGSPVMGSHAANGRPESRSATPQNPQM
ncbi:hypothetical protein K490DRAFT_16228, partial [Saccharata proteae CBS 121410]